MAFNLTKFKILTFDIYATLIDWESGIFQQLSPLLERLPASHPLQSQTTEQLKKYLLSRYRSNEHAIQAEHPALNYTDVLAGVYQRLAADLELEAPQHEAVAFGQGIGSWEAYPDTVVAMQTLGKYYKLAPLSNVDRASFNRTLAGPLKGVHFDAIYVAEDIGSYKPDLNNFHYMIDHVKQDFGIEKMDILHVAQSLTADHVPAKAMGMSPSVYISREGEKGGMAVGFDEIMDKINLGATYATLGEFAVAVEKAFAAVN